MKNVAKTTYYAQCTYTDWRSGPFYNPETAFDAAHQRAAYVGGNESDYDVIRVETVETKMQLVRRTTETWEPVE